MISRSALATVATACLVATSLPAAAQDGAAVPVQASELPGRSTELARQIWEIAMPPAERPAIFAGVMRNIGDQMKQAILPGVADAGLRALLEEKLASVPQRMMPVTEKHIPALMHSYARAYAREFSEAELNEILAFARTPAGRHYLSRSTALLSDPDVAAANRAYFADAQVAQRQFMAEVTRDAAAYAAQHPEAAATKTGSQ